MRKIQTHLGEGIVTEKDDSGRITKYRVVGAGFDGWFAAHELPFDDEVIKDDKPRDNFFDVKNDDDECCHDDEELDFGSDFFKVVDEFITEDHHEKREDFNPHSVHGKLNINPELFAREINASVTEIDPNMDAYVRMLEANETLREAAWKDVRAKATRLRKESKVSINEITPRAIFANVTGDNGVYDTVVVRGGAVVGAGSITEWSCSCEWGKHAFLRKHTYVGRLCSHAYAAYLELQSKTKVEFNRDIKKQRSKPVPHFSSLNVTLNPVIKKDNGAVRVDLMKNDCDEVTDETSTIHINDKQSSFVVHEDEDGEYRDHKPGAGRGWAEQKIFNREKGERPEGENLQDITKVKKIDNMDYLKTAGRVFSQEEKNRLINEADGDESILSRLNLDGTHYVR